MRVHIAWRVLVQLGLYLQFYMPIALPSIRTACLARPRAAPQSHVQSVLQMQVYLMLRARNLLLSLLYEISVWLLASVFWRASWSGNSGRRRALVLYEVLLFLALRVDGRGLLLGLLAAAHREVGAEEGRAEGRHGKLFSHLSASIHHRYRCESADIQPRRPRRRSGRCNGSNVAPNGRGVPALKICAIERTGQTYDVRSDLAAGDSVHSNHDGGIGVVFGREEADEGSMDGRSAAFGWIARGSFSEEQARRTT